MAVSCPRSNPQLCPTLCDPIGTSVHGISQARILEWVAIPFSRGIFPTQGSNSGLLNYRQILYHLSHQGRPAEKPDQRWKDRIGGSTQKDREGVQPTTQGCTHSGVSVSGQNLPLALTGWTSTEPWASGCSAMKWGQGQYLPHRVVSE